MRKGRMKRTANIITARGCKNQCLYCSESKEIAQAPRKTEPIERILKRVIETIALGAEAAFFDDRVL